jgi:hypothetical protein
MNVSLPMRYPFTSHSRRMIIITIISAIILIVFGSLALRPVFNIGAFILVVYLLAIAALAVLLIVLVVQYGYLRAGVWIGPDDMRVKFPLEDLQQMSWSEALFAVNEGEDYLRLSKGREGLGQLFGKTRYIRLHLEGMTTQQRTQVEEALAEHVAIRQPQRFTFITLIDKQGQIVARGRLYLFEDELVCAENRGAKRVFFIAPLKDLRALRQVDSFHIRNLECEAFSLNYAQKTYTIMLGYETTIATNLGTSSRWSATGYAQDWIEALRTRA